MRNFVSILAVTISSLFLLLLASTFSPSSSSSSSFSFCSAQSITRVQARTAATGIDSFYSGFKLGTNAYYGCYSSPAKVARVELTSLAVTASVATNSTTSYFISSNLWTPASSSTSFGIFSTIATSHLPQILKLNLNSMTFNSEKYTGTSGTSIYTGVVSQSTGKAYYANYNVPSSVFEIALDTMTATGNTSSGISGENYFESSALLSGGTHIIFGSAVAGIGAALVKFQIIPSLVRVAVVHGANTDESKFVSISMIDEMAFVVASSSTRVIKFNTTGSMSRVGVAIYSNTGGTSGQFYASAVVSTTSSAGIAVASFQATPGLLLGLEPSALSFNAQVNGTSSSTERLFRSVITDGVNNIWIGTGTSPATVVQFVHSSTPAPTTAPGGSTSAPSSGGTTTTSAAPAGVPGVIINGGFSPRTSAGALKKKIVSSLVLTFITVFFFVLF